MPYLQCSAGSGCNSLFDLALSSIPNIPESLTQCEVLGLPFEFFHAACFKQYSSRDWGAASIGFMCVVISIWIRVMLLELCSVCASECSWSL